MCLNSAEARHTTPVSVASHADVQRTSSRVPATLVEQERVKNPEERLRGKLPCEHLVIGRFHTRDGLFVRDGLSVG